MRPKNYQPENVAINARLPLEATWSAQNMCYLLNSSGISFSTERAYSDHWGFPRNQIFRLYTKFAAESMAVTYRFLLPVSICTGGIVRGPPETFVYPFDFTVDSAR